MTFSDSARQCRDLILNNKLATFLSVALFAFIISTLSLASSNQNKKEAIAQCEAAYKHSTEGPTCSVDIQKDLPVKDPVYLIKQADLLHLWAPYGSALVWNKSVQQSALLCSGTGNELVQTKTAVSYKSCIQGSKFNIEGGITASSKELECKETVTADSVVSTEACGNDWGVKHKIGFDAGNAGFVEYIQSCFDPKRLSVLFTRHILPGAAIASAVTNVDDIAWNSKGIADTVNPETLYKQDQQMLQFTKLLGSEEQAKKYLVTDKQYLSKGHMTPKGDGVFRTWKHATFFYTNAVPQWNTVNAGNWNRVELLVQSIASLLKEDLIVIQGTSGVLSLLHLNGAQIPVSLDDSGIDIPLWTWKIVKSPSKDAGIAFVTLNNPFESKVANLKPLCDDNCDTVGFSKKEFKDFAQGYTICCDPNHLLRMVRYAPDEGMVQNVLTHTMLSSRGTVLFTSLSLIFILFLLQLIRTIYV
ncbi:uncharacterized protein LOC131692593 [Topomyia yanbarensis]|uniref:uncharacterized protein LOC131692593 n=1 Tax=Topomyia yanbarensis TaxID=2498891 RepID=UPI00273CB6C8|nr:uncharacterized protein LOC131692593 [Topomyia yanbarensis]